MLSSLFSDEVQSSTGLISLQWHHMQNGAIMVDSIQADENQSVFSSCNTRKWVKK